MVETDQTALIIIIIIIIIPFNIVKTHAQPYKHIIHVYVYNEQPVSQDSNNAAHTLPRRTAGQF